MLNLQGAGDTSGDIKNVRVILKLSGSRYQKGGSSYIKMDQCKGDVKHGGLTVRFDNLFNGQKNLEDAANQVINQNTNLLDRELLPQVERVLETKTLQAINQVFLRANEFEIFPN